jgi:hypothetical protein
VWAASLLRADMIFGKEIADSRRPEETASDGRCDTRRCMALYELSPACGLRCSWAAYYCSMMSQRMAPLEADLRCSRSPGPPLQHGGVGGALQNARAYSPRSCRTMWSEEFRSPRLFRRQLVCELRPFAFATARISSEMAARMARIIGTTIIDEHLAGHQSGKCSKSLDDGRHRVG